jgi:hypothetical protein
MTSRVFVGRVQQSKPSDFYDLLQRRRKASSTVAVPTMNSSRVSVTSTLLVESTMRFS